MNDSTKSGMKNSKSVSTIGEHCKTSERLIEEMGNVWIDQFKLTITNGQDSHLRTQMDILGSLSRQLDIVKSDLFENVINVCRDYLFPANNPKISHRNQSLEHGSNAIVEVTT